MSADAPPSGRSQPIRRPDQVERLKGNWGTKTAEVRAENWRTSVWPPVASWLHRPLRMTPQSSRSFPGSPWWAAPELGPGSGRLDPNGLGASEVRWSWRRWPIRTRPISGFCWCFFLCGSGSDSEPIKRLDPRWVQVSSAPGWPLHDLVFFSSFLESSASLPGTPGPHGAVYLRPGDSRLNMDFGPAAHRNTEHYGK